jgi:hypothetical protein
VNICVPYLATVPTKGDCLPPSVYLSLRFPADAFDKDNDLDGDGSRSPKNPDDILKWAKRFFLFQKDYDFVYSNPFHDIL